MMGKVGVRLEEGKVWAKGMAKNQGWENTWLLKNMKDGLDGERATGWRVEKMLMGYKALEGSRGHIVEHFVRLSLC